MLSLPGSNDAWYGGHVGAACEQHKDTCLGVIKLALAEPEKWITNWASEPEAKGDVPPWLSETADLMQLDVDILAELFPFRQFFFDIVHPNHLANRIAGRQLNAFLKAHWEPVR